MAQSLPVLQHPRPQGHVERLEARPGLHRAGARPGVPAPSFGHVVFPRDVDRDARRRRAARGLVGSEPECHTMPVPDRSGGRVFLLAPSGFAVPELDLPAATEATLVEAVIASDEWLSRRARLELQQRAMEQRLSASALDGLRALLAKGAQAQVRCCARSGHWPPATPLRTANSAHS